LKDHPVNLTTNHVGAKHEEGPTCYFGPESVLPACNAYETRKANMRKSLSESFLINR